MHLLQRIPLRLTLSLLAIALPSGCGSNDSGDDLPKKPAPEVAIVAPSTTGAFETVDAAVSIEADVFEQLPLATVKWRNELTGESGPAALAQNWEAVVPVAVGSN